jgi:hypothetical protein
MFMTWTGWRARTRLAVAGVTLGALVAAAPGVSASTLGGQAAASADGPVVGPVAGTANGAVRGLANGAVDEFLCHLALAIVTGRRLVTPRVCRRWLFDSALWEK